MSYQRLVRQAVGLERSDGYKQAVTECKVGESDD